MTIVDGDAKLMSEFLGISVEIIHSQPEKKKTPKKKSKAQRKREKQYVTYRNTGHLRGCHTFYTIWRSNIVHIFSNKNDAYKIMKEYGMLTDSINKLTGQSIYLRIEPSQVVYMHGVRMGSVHLESPAVLVCEVKFMSKVNTMAVQYRYSALRQQHTGKHPATRTSSIRIKKQRRK